jgi:ABC-type methionine transport system permease subunit
MMAGFSSALLPMLGRATIETLLMVSVSTALAGIAGLALGVLVVATELGGVLPAPRAHRVLGAAINVGRSIPFIILMVAIIPFTRLVVGTSIGTSAAIVPLVVGAIPYVARLAESALKEVDRGVIEAVVTMGATPWQVVRRAYIPEAVPALVRAVTLTAITLVGYSAMAGAVGGGGLGDVAIRYGYQRFRPDVMVMTVIVLVAMVQAIQFAGESLARRLDRR